MCCKAVKNSEGLEFISNGDGTCYVSGIGTCTDTDIIIPSVSPTGDIVASIGNGKWINGKCTGFFACNAITSVVIPDSVMSIGQYAFRYCNLFALCEEGEAYKAFLISKSGKLFPRTGHGYYELNKKSSVEGKLRCCSNGIHCCKNLFDIFTYYCGEYGKDFVIAKCDISSEYVSHGEDSKIACRWIIPKHILTKEELIQTLNKQER